MKLCIIGIHQWKPVKVYHYYDTSFCNSGEQGCESTTVTFMCKNCNSMKSQSFYGAGFLSLKELN
jgi:hypothetical protein